MRLTGIRNTYSQCNNGLFKVICCFLRITAKRISCNQQRPRFVTSKHSMGLYCHLFFKSGTDPEIIHDELKFSCSEHVSLHSVKHFRCWICPQQQSQCLEIKPDHLLNGKLGLFFQICVEWEQKQGCSIISTCPPVLDFIIA